MNLMERVHFDIPDERAFIEEVLHSVESFKDHAAKVTVLAKTFMALRGRCYAEAAIMFDEAPPTREEAVMKLLKLSAMYYPEGEWRRFGDLLYPKEGPLIARVLEAVKKNRGPR